MGKHSKSSKSGSSVWDRIAERVSNSQGSSAGGSSSEAQTAVVSQEQQDEMIQARDEMVANSHNTNSVAYTQAVATLRGYRTALENDPAWTNWIDNAMGVNSLPTYSQSSQSVQTQQTQRFYDPQSGMYHNGKGNW